MKSITELNSCSVWYLLKASLNPSCSPGCLGCTVQIVLLWAATNNHHRHPQRPMAMSCCHKSPAHTAQAAPQRPVDPPAPGKVEEQRGAGMSLNFRVPGETFWQCVLFSVPSPSRALDRDRRAEGDLSRDALCPEYLYRVCPVPGGKAAPWDLHTTPWGQPCH